MKLPWLPSDPLDARTFSEIRRRAIFDCCKWDPQVEDVSVLAQAPVILRAEAWSELAAMAEALDRETLAAERELLRHPALQCRLALPRSFRCALRTCPTDSTHSTLRAHRYDFHFTAEGWRLSEVNSDVPGGYIEAAGFTRLVADACNNLRICGDPAGALAREVAKALTGNRAVALIHATAYSDDRQVMAYLSKRFAELGVQTILAAPDHVEWRGGHALIDNQPIGAALRFFPAEWLVNLPRRCAWVNFARSQTAVINPATALLTQSKRFPLVWDQLQTPLTMWRKLLPETRPPIWRDASRPDPRWVYKPALGRVGDGIGLCGATTQTAWRSIRRSLQWQSNHWIAQRRFEALPMTTYLGPMYPAFGVFVIAGRACGVYGRMSPQPLIDHRALDAAVLVEHATTLQMRPKRMTPCTEELLNGTAQVV